MAVIIGQNRRRSGPKPGPANNCQTLVTKDGAMRRLAAVSGEVKTPNTPMATVGSPMPVTPLTMPAAKKVAVTADMKMMERSDMTHR
jgi:hypothetical protein